MPVNYQTHHPRYIKALNMDEIDKIIKRKLIEQGKILESRKKKRKKQKIKPFGVKDIRWQVLRRKVFQAYGRVCMKCGDVDNLHVDHVKPKSKYPRLAYKFSNMQILCKTCNYDKSNKNCNDYRQKFEQEGYDLAMLVNMPEL